jgi:hypothetical protein
MSTTDSKRRLTVAAVVVAAAAAAIALADRAWADKPGGDPHLHLHPWTYVGKAGDCGAGAPAGTNIVASALVKKFGLPDTNGKPGDALMLSKNGPTADCSSAGASIDGVGPKKKGVQPGITLTELGYDVRNGGHCGAGAPRFNVVATDGNHFMGACGNATVTPDTPQPGWMRVRIDPTNPAQAFPPLAAGATIISIDVVFDEGVDTGPDLSGFVMLDNIDVNGTLLGKKANDEDDDD